MEFELFGSAMGFQSDCLHVFLGVDMREVPCSRFDQARYPPSTVRAAPVMKSDSGLAR
jgi:hypothetical protein